VIAVRFAEWPRKPTESTLVTWSKFDPPLWGKRWDGLPVFTHTRNHSRRTRGVDNVSFTAWLSAFFLDPTSWLFETYLLLVLGSGYPPFFKAFYSSEERNLHCLFVCPNEWEVCGESPDFSFSCLFRQRGYRFRSVLSLYLFWPNFTFMPGHTNMGNLASLPLKCIYQISSPSH